MVSIFVANLITYHDEGFIPERNTKVCLSTDEEDVGLNGLDWIIKDNF